MSKVKQLEKKQDLQGKTEYVHQVTSKWAMSQMKLSGATVKVFGEENIPPDQGVLFVSNHQGNFDIALFMAYIDKPKGYIAKVELKKIPLLRTWMSYMNCIFMDRGDMRQSAKAILEGIELLKRGHSLVLFPEGTRSRGNQMGNFKAGSFKLATKSKVPIVPVTINGSYKLMEQNGGKVKPASVEIHIHPMVETDSLTKEEEIALPSKIKTIIESKLAITS